MGRNRGEKTDEMKRTQWVLIALLAVLLGGYFVGRGLWQPGAPVQVPREATRPDTGGSIPPAPTAANPEDASSIVAKTPGSGSTLRAPAQSPPPQAPTEKPPELTVINERTLVGTEWGSDQFKLEFGPDGKLLIGGDARANWRIENGRVKLYSSDGREVHWLDIEGNRLSWNGAPIGRFK